MRRLHLALFLAAAFLLSACAGRYALAPDAPRATLHVTHHLPHGTIVGWHAYPDLQCQDKSHSLLGAFSALYDQERRIPIAAGQTMYLRVLTETRNVGQPVGCNFQACSSRCTVVFQATPVAGRTYFAQHESNGLQCSVTIRNEATGDVAPEFRPETVGAGCRP